MALTWYAHAEEVFARVVLTICVCAVLAVFACFVWKCPALDTGSRRAILAVRRKRRLGRDTYEMVGETDGILADMEEIVLHDMKNTSINLDTGCTAEEPPTESL